MRAGITGGGRVYGLSQVPFDTLALASLTSAKAHISAADRLAGCCQVGVDLLVFCAQQALSG